MKKILALLVLSCAAVVAHGQACFQDTTATLTGTTTDSDSVPWDNAAFTATLNTPGGSPAIDKNTSRPVCRQVTGVLTSAGAWTGNSIERTDAIIPFGAYWTFSIQSVTSAAPSVLNNVIIAASTFNMGTYSSSKVTAPRFVTNKFGAFGYNVVETQPNPCIDYNQYLNVTTGITYVCNGGTYIAPVPPVTTSLFGDGYITIIPNTPAAGETTIGHTNLAQLNTANIYSTGTQSIQTGSSTTIGETIVSQGTGVPGYISQTSGAGGGPWGSLSVSVGQYLLMVTGNYSTTPPTDTLGNTFTLLSSVGGCFGGSGGGVCVFGAPVVHAGTDQFRTSGYTALVSTLSNINLANPFDTDAFSFELSLVTGANPLSYTINPTSTSDMILSYFYINGGGCTGSFTVPSGFTNEFSQTTTPLNINALTSNAGTVTANWTATLSTFPCGADNFAGLIALHSASGFVQGAPYETFVNGLTGQTNSNVDQYGRYQDPQSAGYPGDSPTLNGVAAGGATVYDTTNNRLDYFNVANGWSFLVDNVYLTAQGFATNAAIGTAVTAAVASLPDGYTTQETGGVAPIKAIGVQSGATAPTGACTHNGLWNFTADGKATYCNGTTWVNVNVGGTPRTCNANGCYTIASDGTYDEDIISQAISNNATTNLTLPASIPTAIMSNVCNDDGGRVQSGNTQPVGSNFVGLTAPYTVIQVLSPATGVSVSCHIRGY